MNRRKMIREIYVTYLLFWLVVTSRYPIGTNVYKRDWDVLIVLDTCRVDALHEIKSEYDFLHEVGSIWSVGSTSKEWIEQTFTTRFDQEISDTAYITGNPFSDILVGERELFDYGATTEDTWIEQSNSVKKLVYRDLVEEDDFGHVEFLQTGESKTVKPRTITDHTIKAARADEFESIIAHYMQPHTPYYSSSKNYDRLNEYEKYPFEAIRHGDKNKKDVWEAYLDNLRYVLDDIELLANNIDGEVVITADHGELFGELGMYYHHAGNFHPKLKMVPWARINASDNKTYVPDVSLEGRSPDRLSDEQLKALGYI